MKRLKQIFIPLFFLCLVFGGLFCGFYFNSKIINFYNKKNTKNVKINNINNKNYNLKINSKLFCDNNSNFYKNNSKNVKISNKNNKKYNITNFYNKNNCKKSTKICSATSFYNYNESNLLIDSIIESFGTNSLKNRDKTQNYTKNFEFCYKNRVFRFESDRLIKDISMSDTQKRLYKDKNLLIKVFYRLQDFGLNKREILTYIFPELEEIKHRLCNIIDIYPESGYVEVVKNACKINYISGKQGEYLNQDEFYKKIYENVKNGNFNIKIDILSDSYNDNLDIKNEFQEKSSFFTNFSTSSPSRKNNIRVSLSRFDGLVLEPGESFSFNRITGIRDEKAGYQKAKIITGGTFVQGFGGGVCQVSTTIYNACLLAGLEILEVHNHSLPVSYVEPSFDAMVNSGSSDLKVRNNTNGRILITTSWLNDKCSVKIFGEKNKYKIVKFSEKTKILPAENDVIETDYKKFGEELEIGEEKRLSFPKDGFCSSGYLKYFDENGVLIKTVKIRENRYNPTKGIVLKNLDKTETE